MVPIRQPLARSSILSDVRRATSGAHAALDQALALSTESITFARYEAFLLGTERIVRRVEPLVATVVPRVRDTDRLGSLRSACIERDLARMGRVPPSCRAELPPAPVPAPEAWGIAYVLEGSALGGLVLAARVERALGLDMGDGTSFLRLRGKGTGAYWGAFLAAFEAFGEAALPAEHARTCAAAEQLFRDYAESFRHSGAIS